MAEVRVNKPISRRIRHRGRASQIPIYVGKQLRFFIYQSDWKVLPSSKEVPSSTKVTPSAIFIINHPVF